jgi:hypothetical protein
VSDQFAPHTGGAVRYILKNNTIIWYNFINDDYIKSSLINIGIVSLYKYSEFVSTQTEEVKFELHKQAEKPTTDLHIMVIHRYGTIKLPRT